MTITHRLLRRLGKDTTITESHTIPVYKYTITHTNGEITEEVAHGYNVDGAFIRIYVYTEPGVYPGIAGPAYSVYASGQKQLRVLDSIQEIEKEKIGETTFEATIDKADGKVLNKIVKSDK